MNYFLKKFKFNKENYKPSTEQHRKEVEIQRNKNRQDMYRDKQVCEEYERWLDMVGHP